MKPTLPPVAAKVPSIIHLVDQFPMTASGKVQKFRLAETFGPPE